mmetsp:Transcript_6104/g.14614  ORF Transcript_6104/g.14614 Transcript_6104/m.14614 type:complete len:359 (-) Transcript_6104:2434-3510(-)
MLDRGGLRTPAICVIHVQRHGQSESLAIHSSLHPAHLTTAADKKTVQISRLTLPLEHKSPTIRGQNWADGEISGATSLDRILQSEILVSLDHARRIYMQLHTASRAPCQIVQSVVICGRGESFLTLLESHQSTRHWCVVRRVSHDSRSCDADHPASVMSREHATSGTPNTPPFATAVGTISGIPISTTVVDCLTKLDGPLLVRTAMLDFRGVPTSQLLTMGLGAHLLWKRREFPVSSARNCDILFLSVVGPINGVPRLALVAHTAREENRNIGSAGLGNVRGPPTPDWLATLNVLKLSVCPALLLDGGVAVFSPIYSMPFCASPFELVSESHLLEFHWGCALQNAWLAACHRLALLMP